MDVLTIDDIGEMADIVNQQQLSTTQLRMFALNQDLDVAKVFISTMRDRHGVDIMC